MKLILILLLTACAKADVSQTVLKEPQPHHNGSTCMSAVQIMHQTLVKGSYWDIYTIYDGSYSSGIKSLPLSPNSFRYIDANYGCMHEFFAFELRNGATYQWSFGSVKIYYKANYEDSWQLLTEMTENDSKMKESGAYSKNVTPIQTQFIRYEFYNNTSEEINIILTDIESVARFVK